MYYVYLLLDPTKFYLPLYIGKGKEERWKVHLTETLQQTQNKRKYFRIQKIRKAGFEPVVMFWEQNMDESAAYDLETELIKRFGRKRYDPEGILENLCVDAKPPGFKYCQDQDEFRKKISEATKGENNPFYGKKHTEETRAKIGAAHKGKTISEIQKIQISEKHKGKVLSEETKKKMSESAKGKKHSPEHSAKTGAIHKGKIISDEQKAQISAKLTGRKNSEETRKRKSIAAKEAIARRKSKT